MRIGFDTIVAAHLLDEQRSLSLLDQASTELGVGNWGKGAQGFGIGEGEPLELLGERGKKGLSPLYGEDSLGFYCARDVGYTHLLYERQVEQLRGDPEITRLMKKLVLPGLDAFVEVELNGIWVDEDRLVARRAELVQRRTDTEERIFSEYVDPRLRAEWEEKRVKNKHKKPLLGNPFFLRAWLFSEKADGGLGLVPNGRTPTGLAKTDEKALKALDHPVTHELATYAKTLKGLQFFDAWREWLGYDGRLHPSFNLTGTVTGRRSCNNPNLMQVPRDPFLRSVLGAPPGWIFMEADYSQIEVRLAAWFAQEENMLSVFERDGDIYRFTAADLLEVTPEEITKEDRQKAKAYVLGFLYGMGINGFVIYAKDTFGLTFTHEEAQARRDGYFALYPNLIHWHESEKALARRDLQRRSVTGRVRHLLNILSSNKAEQHKAERQAINSPVQGTGGDFTLASIVELMDTLPRDEVVITGDIHDAVLFQIREEVWVEHARTILGIMERPRIMVELGVEPPIRMKVEGSVGTHWDKGNTEFSLETLDEVVAGVSFERAA